MSMSSLWDILLSNDILLYVGIFLDGVVSFFLWKKTKKKNNVPDDPRNIVGDDIQAMIDYHKQVAERLEEKLNKKGE